jgi:glycosyltransferase involved in cell wall biosynthesis
VVHSDAQFKRAAGLGFTGEQVVRVPYQVDTRFWHPQSVAATHIASAGQEFRDYLTLMWAVDGIDVPVRVAAGSLWSSREKNFGRTVPKNVQIGRLPYDELRSMYASSLFVVVPLHDVDFQAGIITILEAMAMGKAVITSRTAGQRGVVTGPMMVDGRLEETGERAWTEPTGLYVPPGRADALRQAIAYLLARPDEAARMGAAGRRHVEADLTIEHFVERMAAIIDPSVIETVSEGVSA